MSIIYEDVAHALDTAERTCNPIAPLSEQYPGLTAEQAYAIQSAWFAIKRAQGTQLIGRKIGLTSRAMQASLGIDQPDYGFLLDTMLVSPDESIPRSTLLQPRLEPEIAFWLAEDLRGPGVTLEDVLAATSGVSPALELVDSRIVDWRIKLVDTIADNASSARVIVAKQIIPVQGHNLVTEEVVFFRNDQEVGRGTGAAVLGHPAAAVAWLANKLAEFDTPLQAGQFVLPGAMCAAISVAAGDTFRASFSSLGNISISFT
jgi:2-keto-4-pentenoate hydratase